MGWIGSRNPDKVFVLEDFHQPGFWTCCRSTVNNKQARSGGTVGDRFSGESGRIERIAERARWTRIAWPSVAGNL